MSTSSQQPQLAQQYGVQQHPLFCRGSRWADRRSSRRSDWPRPFDSAYPGGATDDAGPADATSDGFQLCSQSGSRFDRTPKD